VVLECAQEAARSGAPVTMPVYRMTRERDVHDPSVVKVVREHSGRTLYCSRSPVPHIREPRESWSDATTFWGHVGMYAYTREFLASFGVLPPSPLEDSERLEQLRWLQAGLHLHSFEVEPQGPSIDTYEDLDEARAVFEKGWR
jgi:3-deoxy-manno-octulosonate cytidylyltransferase (CMP-KDO synthetase)